jgi:predicted TIM-barrel fold metal-dependent hydrolase
MGISRRSFLGSVAALKAARAFAAPFEWIDSHVHIHRDAPRLLSSMEKAGWRALSICVSAATTSSDASDLEAELKATARLWRDKKKRLAWATTFDARSFEDPDFPDRTITSLRQSFDQGAIGVKVWKNLGLGIRSKSGEYLLPDNPALMPVYEAIQKSGKTLLVHLAGTSGGWMPIDANNPEYNYYKVHPEWNLYGRPGAPTKAAIMAARDRVLARFPKLRVIGCHIGSMEDDLESAARRFDAYPNLAVDTAAKVRYLAHGNREEVRQFLLQYRDRILYATDFTLGTGDEEQAWKSLQATYEQDWKFFAGGEPMQYQGRQVQGLALPHEVLHKIFYGNATHWLQM